MLAIKVVEQLFPLLSEQTNLDFINIRNVQYRLTVALVIKN